MSCRAGCPTQDHASYGECLRSAGVRVAYANSTNGWDYTKQKKWQNELDAYKAVKKEGIQPKTTSLRDIDQAKAISDKAQVPYDGRRF